MGIDGIGSSVVVALAAVLWFLYLVPTWLKRREYLATERNAVRLQQTMRVMAESAELPAIVRVEATARTAAAQARALRKHQRRAARVADTRRLSSTRSARIETTPPERRLRRSRLLATVVLLASLVAGGFGISAFLAEGSWVLIAASVVVAMGSFALLGQAAAVSRARAELRRATSAVHRRSALHDDADYVQERRPGWIPIPLPKPLYLEHPAPLADTGRSSSARSDAADRRLNGARNDAAGRRSSGARSDAAGRRLSSARSARIETSVAPPHEPLDHAAALHAAAAEAERALRAAQAAPEVARIERPAAPAAQSRFARMGRIEAADAVPADLDDILRRRRAVG